MNSERQIGDKFLACASVNPDGKRAIQSRPINFSPISADELHIDGIQACVLAWLDRHPPIANHFYVYEFVIVKDDGDHLEVVHEEYEMIRRAEGER